MPRPTINSLNLSASRTYWPSLAMPHPDGGRFDLRVKCQAEDEMRSKASQKGGLSARDKRTRKALLKLARKLHYEARKKRVPRSLACSLHMRSKRNAIFSHVWRLADEYRGAITTATVIKRRWEFTPSQLETVDLGRLLKGFLADLDRRGAASANGWLIAFIHGEYETPLGVIRLHLHMIVAGEMIKVVDKLRRGRKYKFSKDDDVYCRVRIDRKPLTNLPYPFTYCLKAYWPSKHVTMTAKGKRRTRKHKRIPEPVHTQVLQFLDRHTVDHLSVLKHMSVKRGRLLHSNRRRGGK